MPAQPIPSQPSPAPDASQLEIVSAIEQLHESVRELTRAQAGPAGTSYLTVPVPQAQPPGGEVAPGILTACVPVSTGITVNKTDFLLQFPFQQGFTLNLNRIHLFLPVWMEELKLEKTINTFKTEQTFKTELEAEEAVGGKGGLTAFTETVKPVAFQTPFERVRSNFSYARVGAKVVTTEETITERSVLPITVQVVARLKGPDGELWSGSFDVPLHYVAHLPGAANGSGLIDAYADLHNSIAVSTQRTYSLQLLVLVPSSVATDTQIGIETEGLASFRGNGAVTIFYDVDPVPVGK